MTKTLQSTDEKSFFIINELRIDAVKFSSFGSRIDSRMPDIIRDLCGINPEMCRIVKKSIDSRRGRPEIIYKLVIQTGSAPNNIKADKITPEQAAEILAEPEIEIETLKEQPRQPVVVGTGPAGIFAGLVLALAGAKPLILDRGKNVDERAGDIDEFYKTRTLNEESNYLIGEGGAGTFSDGKLYTRNHDPRGAWVLAQFAGAGADYDTVYLKRPHLGSDKLPGIIANLRKKIIELGGEFRFSAHVTDILLDHNNRCAGVKLASGENITADAVIIAAGLGGRKLTMNLLKYAGSEPKGFQIGCRIEHPQEMVDRKQYRCSPRPPTLGAAEYNLAMSPTPSKPGASTFCMCPGGTVIPATAVSGELSSNGMSNRARDGEFANSTIVVTPDRTKFKTHAEAFGFLSALGRKTFYAGGEDYGFPAQDADAFLTGNVRLLHKKSSVQTQLVPADISSLLPQEITATIRRALREFDRRFPGFIKYGKLIGVESYVSSPVRFIRDINMMSTVEQLYFAGEGAGMAGGILSAAVDGIKVAQAVIKKFNQI